METVDVGRDLRPGERVLWRAPARRGVMLTPRDGFLIPFGAMFLGFSVFWNAQVWTSDAPGFFRFWGLPFLAAGFYIVAGRFLHDAWIRRQTRYLVTDQRVLIIREGRSRVSTALDIGRLPEITLSERPDGSGTVRFGPAWSAWDGRDRGDWHAWLPAADPTPQFIEIDGVRNVVRIIEQAAAARSAAGGR